VADGNGTLRDCIDRLPTCGDGFRVVYFTRSIDRQDQPQGDTMSGTGGSDPGSPYAIGAAERRP